MTTSTNTSNDADSDHAAGRTPKITMITVSIKENSPSVTEGQFIRQPGSDIRQGMLVLESGQVIRAPEIGLLATVGCVSNIQIRAAKVEQERTRAITIGILSSGNELVDSGTESLPAGKIRDSNKCMLMALASELPKQLVRRVVDLGTMRDTGAEIHQAITQRAIEEVGCDLLITSGGVSMGELDLIKPYIEQ